MISLVLAAAVAAGAEPRTVVTLAGVALGSNLRRVVLEHPTARRSRSGSARWWAWSRTGGGTVAITADDLGNVNRVDFVVDKGQDDNIDLPCVGQFPVQDSHVNLEFALNKTSCSAFNGATYGLPDRSLVAIRFDGPGDGQLIEATWYRPSDKNPSPVGHMAAVVDYLQPVLIYSGGSARLYYAGDCPTESRADLVMNGIPFPSVWLQPARGATGMSAAQQIFRDDPNVVVTQDRSGMLRITIGSVSSTVLQTRLPSLTLDATERYNALSAVDKIAITAHIYAKQHGLPFDLGPYIIDHIVSGPVKGAPHLPGVMQNISIDDALDAVARTFKGIATYGACQQPDGKTLFLPGFIHSS